MHHGRPRRVALWLLSRLGCGRDIDSLVGDLMEEHHNGRSLSWLWRQVLLGIAWTVGCEFRAHPLATLRVMSTTGVALVLTYGSIAIVALGIHHYQRVTGDVPRLPAAKAEQLTPKVIDVISPWSPEGKAREFYQVNDE